LPLLSTPISTLVSEANALDGVAGRRYALVPSHKIIHAWRAQVYRFRSDSLVGDRPTCLSVFVLHNRCGSAGQDLAPGSSSMREQHVQHHE
jgi:hypothetical protein